MNIDEEVHRLAATDIQAIFRGYHTRWKARQSKELTDHVQDLAASTLQSTARGFLHSKRIHQRRCKQQRSTAINLAAQTLQSAWWMFLLRKKCGHYLQRLFRLREDEKECQTRPIISSPTSTTAYSSTFSAASYEEEDEKEARIMAPTLQVTAATADDERWAYLPIPTSPAPLFSPPPAYSEYEEDGCEDGKRMKRRDNNDDTAVEKQEDQDEGLWLASSIDTKKGILEERRKDGDRRAQALVEEEEAREQREKKEAWQWSEGDDHQRDQHQSTVTSNPPVVTQHDDTPTSNLAGSASHRSKSGNTVDQLQRQAIAAVDNSSSKAVMLAKMARERQQAVQAAFRHAVAVCCQEIEVKRSELIIILQGIGVLKKREEGDDDDDDDDGSDCKNGERSRTYRLSLASDHDTACSLVRACDQAGLKEEELARTTTTSTTIISAPRAALARQHLLKLIKGEGPEGEAYAFILAQSSSSSIASWSINQITDYAGSLDVPLEAIKKAQQAGKLNKEPRLLLHLSSPTQRTDGNEAEEGKGLVMALGIESSVLKRRLDLYGRILRDIHAWETCGIWPGKAAEEEQRQQHRQQQHRSSQQIDPFPPSNATLRRRQEHLALPRLKKRREVMEQPVAITTPSLTLLSEAIIASSPLTTAAESVLHNRPGYVRLTPSTAKGGTLVWIAPLQELTRAFRSAWRAHGLVEEVQANDSDRPFNLDENGPHRCKDYQASLEDRIWDLQTRGVPERYGRVLGPVTSSLSCSSPAALQSPLLRVALLEPCVGTIMTSSSTSLKQTTLPSFQWVLPSDDEEGQEQNEAIVVELPIRGLYELPSGLRPQVLRMGRRVRVAEGQALRTCLDRASWVDTRETYLDILALEGMEAIVLSTKHARQLGRVGIRTMDAHGYEDAVPLEALQALSDDEEKNPKTRHRKRRASRSSNRSRTRNTSSSSFAFMHTPPDPRRRHDDHDLHQEDEEKGRYIPTPRTSSKYHGPRHHRSSTASRSNSPINNLLFQRRREAHSFQATATTTSRRRHRSFFVVDNNNDVNHPPYQSASEGGGQGLGQKKLSIKGKEDSHRAATPLVLPSIDSSPRPSPPHTGTTATIPIISVQVIPNATQQQRTPSPPSSSLFDAPKHLHQLYRPPPTTSSSSVKEAKIEQEEGVKGLEQAWKRDRRVKAVVVEHAGGDGEVNEARGRPSSSPSTMRSHRKNRSFRGNNRGNSPLKMSHYLEPNRDEHHNHHSASHHDEVHPPHPSSSTQRAPLDLTPVSLVFSPPPPPTSSSSARPRTSISGTPLPSLNATIATSSTMADTKEPHQHPSQQQHRHTRSLSLNKAPPTVRITFNTDRTSTATTRPSSATAHARHASWNGGSSKVTTTSNADHHRDKSASFSSSRFLSSIGDKGPRWRPRSASATTSSSSPLSSRKKQSRPAFYEDDEEEEKVERRRRGSSSPSPTKKKYWQSSGPARSFNLAQDDESDEHEKERSRSSTHSPSRSLVHTPRYYQQDRGGPQSSPTMAPAAALTPSSNIFMPDGELDNLVNLLNDFSSSTTNMTAATVAAKVADSPSKSIKAFVAEEREKGLRSAVFSASAAAAAAAAVDREDRRTSGIGDSAAGARRPISAASASRARSSSNGSSNTPNKERIRTKARNSLSSNSDNYTTTEGSRLEKKLKQIERQSQARMAQIRHAVERLQRTSSIPWDEEEEEEE